MDFYLDMGNCARAYLRAFGHKQADRLTDEEVAVAFFRIMDRIPTATPRTFERPAGPLPGEDEVAEGLAQLQREVEQGQDLTPRMSTTLERTQNDPLFNDWGIYHFHLGTSVKPSGFVERTNLTAFAVIEDKRFLLLGLFPHDPAPYEDTDLLRLWKANWPESIARHRLDAQPDQTVIDHSADAASIQGFRKAGINALTYVDGDSYLPPRLGVTGDGGSFQALRQHDRMAKAAVKLQGLWTVQFPGVEGRFRMLNDTWAAVEHPDGTVWQWQDASSEFTRLPELTEQQLIAEFRRLGIN